jgi:aspartate/methionine/tyrosine aminotransferase
MKIPPFRLERFFARHEFSAKYLLSSSDCEALRLDELIKMADPESRDLWHSLSFGYTETMGLPALREVIADFTPGVTREDILIAAPEECIFLVMQALLAPGDHMVCTYPGYQSLYEVARTIGCDVTFWEADESAGWGFDVDRLGRLLRKDTRLVVVNFPHNPTGFLPDKCAFDVLVERVRAHGAYLLCDEMYRHLERKPEWRLPACCGIYEKGVSLSGLSKAFGLPGLRIGWVAARDRDLINRMSRLRDYTTICNSAPSEILGLMALRRREKILSRQQERIDRNIGYLDDFMARYDHRFQWHRPKGGTICFPRLKGGLGAQAFCERLIAEEGILLVPSTMFGYGDRHVRIGFGREDFPEGIGRLSTTLDRSMGKRSQGPDRHPSPGRLPNGQVDVGSENQKRTDPSGCRQGGIGSQKGT